MSKLGYFFAGVVAGATALTAAAFMVDEVAHKMDAVSDDEGDSEDIGSNGSTGNTEDAGETVNSAIMQMLLTGRLALAGRPTSKIYPRQDNKAWI